MRHLFSFWAPVEVKSVNATRDRHWAVRKRRTDSERRDVFYAWPQPFRHHRWDGYRKIVVTLAAVVRREMDDDNQGLKAVRDEIAKIIGIDDGDDVFEWVYRKPIVGKPPRVLVRVDVEEANE